MSSDRIQVLDYPRALPGMCAICGYSGGDERKFIDFGFELDFYGVVYFCSSCVTSAANSLGWISREQSEILKAQLEEKTQEWQKGKTENARLRDALISLDIFPQQSFGRNKTGDEKTRESVSTKRQDDSGSSKSSDDIGLENLPDDVESNILNL